MSKQRSIAVHILFVRAWKILEFVKLEILEMLEKEKKEKKEEKVRR